MYYNIRKSFFYDMIETLMICFMTPKIRGPLTTRQPAENLYVSYHETHT